MTRFLLELLSVASRLVNVLTGGSADLTFSARNYIEGLPTRRFIDWIFRPWGREHCREVWDNEVSRARTTIALDDARN